MRPGKGGRVHRASREEMAVFARMLPPTPLRIAEVGSKGEDGAYGPVFRREGWDYVGLDFSEGPNVDMVLPDEHRWPNLRDGEFDVVVASRPLGDESVKEASRIIGPGGWACIVDPRRNRVDGMRAAIERNGLSVLSVRVSDGGDTVGVARKPYVSKGRGCPCPGPAKAAHRAETVGGREFLCCPGSRMKRNLNYFIYPLKGSIWTWNVDQLRPFLPVFNGRKIVSVAEDGGTEPLMVVADRFCDPSITYIRTKNDPLRKEMATFLGAMGLLRSPDPDEMTFYGHAKGVSYWSSPQVSNIMAWTRAMYVLNLCDVGAIEKLMETHGAVGAFRENHPVWHYSGTFFWLKHSEIFSGAWDRHEAGPLGTETYPGTHIPVERSFDLTFGRYYPNRYDNLFPESEIRSALDELRDVVHGSDMRGPG